MHLDHHIDDQFGIQPFDSNQGQITLSVLFRRDSTKPCERRWRLDTVGRRCRIWKPPSTNTSHRGLISLSANTSRPTRKQSQWILVEQPSSSRWTLFPILLSTIRLVIFQMIWTSSNTSKPPRMLSDQ